MTTTVAKFKGWLARWKGNSTSEPWAKDFFFLGLAICAIATLVFVKDQTNDRQRKSLENRIATIEARLAESEGR